MVSLVKFHTNATSKRWHLWGVNLIFALGLPLGWVTLSNLLESSRSFERKGPGSGLGGRTHRKERGGEGETHCRGSERRSQEQLQAALRH